MQLSSPAQEYLEKAEAAAKNGDYTAALRLLSTGFATDAAYQPLYALAARCLRALDGEDEARLFDAALARFGDANAFYDLGYHFVDVDNDRLALPFLARAHALAPGDARIAAEYALTLCDQMNPCAGIEALERTPFRQFPAASYQYYWCSFLCDKDRAGIAAYLRDARPAAGDAAFAFDKLAEGLERLEAVGEPQPFVRDWHFIQYGAAILDFFDERITPEGLQVAGGRYVYQSGGYGEVGGILRRLATFLRAMEQVPARVVALADRDSEIVAGAAAQILALPLERATAANLAAPGALVVAADSTALADYPALRTTQPNQTVFALSHCWTQGGTLTPDV